METCPESYTRLRPGSTGRVNLNRITCSHNLDIAEHMMRERFRNVNAIHHVALDHPHGRNVTPQKAKTNGMTNHLFPERHLHVNRRHKKEKTNSNMQEDREEAPRNTEKQRRPSSEAIMTTSPSWPSCSSWPRRQPRNASASSSRQPHPSRPPPYWPPPCAASSDPSC